MLEFLKLDIGGYCGYTNISVSKNDDILTIAVTKNHHEISEDIIHLTLRESQEWSDNLDALHINKWKSRYELDMKMCDGIDWSIDYKVVGKHCRHISGSNTYPDNWVDFLAVIDEYVPMEIPIQLDFLEMSFYRKVFSQTSSQIPSQIVSTKCYEEHISIDRNKRTLIYIKKSENEYEMKQQFSAVKKIPRLLDEIIDYFEDSDETAYECEGLSFELHLKYHSGMTKTFKGGYNQDHLPEYWCEALDDIQYFISSNGKLGDIFDPNIYLGPEVEPTYIYCTVIFNNGSKEFYYLTEDDSLLVGDKVIVPCGVDDNRRTATIIKKEVFSESDVPFPVYKTKSVIGKKLEVPFLGQVYDATSYEAIKLYFMTCEKVTQSNVTQFQNKLSKLHCMVHNYHDYLMYDPMDVDKEIKRIDTADTNTVFAIMTMIFREDHFCCGSIIKRVDQGAFDQIIDRIRKLLE